VADFMAIDWRTRPEGVQELRMARAEFSAPGATSYQCRVVRTDPLPDPLPAFSSCGQGRNGHWTSNLLTNGAYRLDVRGQDSVGPGPTASTSFEVAVPGDLTWFTRPTGTVDTRVVTATFGSDRAYSYQCRVYRTDPLPGVLPGFSGCGQGRNGHWVSNLLADGAWRLDVRPTDSAGQLPVTSTDFTIVRQRAITWGVRPTGSVPGTVYAASFASPGALSYQCRLDAGAWTSCGSGRNGHITGLATVGTHTLDVRGVDQIGPGPEASTTFTLAGDPAGTSAEVEIILGPSGTIDTAWTAFAWVAEEAQCYRFELDGEDEDLDGLSCYAPPSWGATATSE
jgi:hypothetical protein